MKWPANEGARDGTKTLVLEEEVGACGSTSYLVCGIRLPGRR